MLLVQSAIFIYWVDRPGEGNPRHAQLRRVLTAAAELGAVFDRRGSVDVGAVLRSQAEPGGSLYVAPRVHAGAVATELPAPPRPYGRRRADPDRPGPAASGRARGGRPPRRRATPLQAATESRRQLFADVSHELKTPLTSMRGYLETLQMDEALPADRRHRYLGTVRDQTMRLERIVADLVDLARVENRPDTLEVRVFAPARVFERVMRR